MTPKPRRLRKFSLIIVLTIAILISIFAILSSDRGIQLWIGDSVLWLHNTNDDKFFDDDDILFDFDRSRKHLSCSDYSSKPGLTLGDIKIETQTCHP